MQISKILLEKSEHFLPKNPIARIIVFIAAGIVVITAVLQLEYSGVSIGSNSNGPSRVEANTIDTGKNESNSELTTKFESSTRDRVTKLSATFQPFIGSFAKEPVNSLSDACHIARLHIGIHCKAVEEQICTREQCCSLLLDGRLQKKSFGDEVFFQTRYGVGVRLLGRLTNRSRNVESHRDQLLATLAELEVAPDSSIVISGGEKSLKSLVRHAMLNFSTKQKEIEWSAIAIAYYVSPAREWRDKYNRIVDLDSISLELLHRLNSEDRSAACNGTHILYAIAYMIQIDNLHKVLSGAVRSRIDSTIQVVTKNLLASQLANGSWLAGAITINSREQEATIGSQSDGTTQKLALHMTSHHLEWLCLAQENSKNKGAQKAIYKAIQFIKDEMMNVSPQKFRQELCPYSHALRVALLIK